jgi:hypothetical protein
MLAPRRLISCAFFLVIMPAATFAQAREAGTQRAAAATTTSAPVAAPKIHSEARSTQGSDTTPAGMVAFFSPTTTACPAGWVARASAGGRLILGVTDGSKVGGTYGQAFADKTPPSHTHFYSAKIKMGSKSLQARKGNNKDGAKAKTYEMNNKFTDAATLDLPYYQLVICQKQ